LASKPRARILRSIMLGILLAAASLAGGLWLFQERFIYPARPYRAEELLSLPSGLTALHDPAKPQSIVGFYRAPAEGGVPQKLWLTFGGNGDQALRWAPLIAPSATRGTAFLLIEYPGYGARAGRPTPESLLTGTEASVQVLARQLGVRVAELEARTSVLGYSIGSAAALQYAARHPVQRIILFSPFTSMLDMARRVVGSPLCHLLAHRYDNLAALRAIQAHGQPPISILHGAQDSLIPHRMGEALARAAPGSHFELVPGAEHGDVIDLGTRRLRQLLAAP
jgi:pimeloyl-ACP methyl ester carboxylesterase